jgi:hypothetical protein
MCAERDRLWAEYDAALQAYIEAVEHWLQAHGPLALAQAREARHKVHDCRAEILGHCFDHECDPEAPKLFAEG